MSHRDVEAWRGAVRLHSLSSWVDGYPAAVEGRTALLLFPPGEPDVP